MVSEIITIKTLSTLIYRVQTFLKFQKSKFQINQSISNMNRLIKLPKKKKKKTRIGKKNTENWINEFLTGEFLVQNSLRPYDTIHSMLQD